MTTVPTDVRFDENYQSMSMFDSSTRFVVGSAACRDLRLLPWGRTRRESLPRKRFAALLARRCRGVRPARARRAERRYGTAWRAVPVYLLAMAACEYERRAARQTTAFSALWTS